MSDKTRIEWADATVNAVNGCSLESPGCTNCYAMKLAGTRLKHHPSRAGLTADSKAGPVWTGEVRLNETALLQPLRWKAARRIFWNAHGDLFHENVPDEWIDRVFAVCALTPQHQHLILTKRSARMRQYFSDATSYKSGDGTFSRGNIVADAARSLGATLRQCREAKLAAWPLPNVWLGVSVEDQARADQRIPDLLATPAAVRFISAEPLLGPVDLTVICADADGFKLNLNALDGFIRHLEHRSAMTGHVTQTPKFGYIDGLRTPLDWVIVGGESGPNARPMHPDWARTLRDQCAAAGVPFFFKQWGEFTALETDADWDRTDWDNPRTDRLVSHNSAHDQNYYRCGKAKAGRLLDGREWSGFPAPSTSSGQSE